MRHDIQDAYDAHERRREPRSRWHPIMQADEREPGVWVLVDGSERDFAVVQIIRRGDEVGYRADALPTMQSLGYWRTLRAACENVFRRWNNRSGFNGPPAHFPTIDDPWVTEEEKRIYGAEMRRAEAARHGKIT